MVHNPATAQISRRSGLLVTCITVMLDDPGSTDSADSCVYYSQLPADTAGLPTAANQYSTSCFRSDSRRKKLLTAVGPTATA